MKKREKVAMLKTLGRICVLRKQTANFVTQSILDVFCDFLDDYPDECSPFDIFEERIDTDDLTDIVKEHRKMLDRCVRRLDQV